MLSSDASLSELYDIKGGVLGGAQSGCRQAIDRRSGVTYALTTFAVSDLHPDKCEELAAAIAAQRQITDPPSEVGDELKAARLLCVHEVLQSPSSIMIMTALAPTTGTLCDDLFSILQRRGQLPEAEARKIFTRLVLATKRAHDCGAVLRNLKPESVQVRQPDPNSAMEVCISDLHCAASVPIGEETATLTGLHGTPEYAAPEVTIWYWHECVPPRLPEPPPPYGTKADVWALGMVLHVMLCGSFPFQTSVPEEELLRAINTANFTYNDPGWRRVSADGMDLVSQLLMRDPNDRPYLEEVLQHPFCSEALAEVMASELSSQVPLGEISDAALKAFDDDD